jgi:predicted phosphodiesterase
LRVAVISDLHLGVGDSADAFGHSDSAFLGFLRRLERDFEHIVLLGDIWETLTSERPFAPVAALRLAREAHPQIARRLERPPYLYVHGNHDLVTADAEGAPEELVLSVEGRRILFTHGHRHDWLIRRARWLSELLVWGGGFTRRLGLTVPYRLGAWLDTWLCRARTASPVDSFRTWAVSLAAHRHADVVVTGHTHVPLCRVHPQGVYLNSGSCSEGRFSFLAIDPRWDRYQLFTE